MSENTSTALATTGAALALIPKSFEDAEKMATKLSESSLLPDHFKKNPANVFWALALGLEVGFTPVQALQAIYVVHGRPGMYADAMVALVLASGKAEFFRRVESSDTSATYETQRRGGAKTPPLTITIEDARKAGWAAQNKKYETEPRRMLEARCKSQLARDVYPDVLRGMASVEELYDDGAGGPTFSAPPPPSKGAIIDIAEAAGGAAVPRGPEPKKQAAAPPPAAAQEEPKPAAEPAKASESELRVRDLAEQMKAAKTGEDLASLLLMAGDLSKKLGAKHPEIVALRKVYSARKAELEEVA